MGSQGGLSCPWGPGLPWPPGLTSHREQRSRAEVTPRQAQGVGGWVRCMLIGCPCTPPGGRSSPPMPLEPVWPPRQETVPHPAPLPQGDKGPQPRLHAQN